MRAIFGMPNRQHHFTLLLGDYHSGNFLGDPILAKLRYWRVVLLVDISVHAVSD
jgi:hypothetical protein